MFVITANVKYYSNGPLVSSFLWFDTKKDDFDWDDEAAEFFSNYQDAWAMVDDITKGRRNVGDYYPEVKDIEIKGIELKETVSTKRNKDYGEMERLIKSNSCHFLKTMI